MSLETIYALSTVYGKSGVAVIRISGKEVLTILKSITNIDINSIKTRYAYYTPIFDKDKKNLLDKALVLYFSSPNSFTGEDIAEIQCHGSKAVLKSILENLNFFDNVRLAEAGEFSKRAFYNNKIDLTEADGLADLIDAETTEQQKYAIKQMEGNLKNLYNGWRESLVKILSYLEAYIDFPEEDISENLYQDILNTVFKVKSEIKNHLSQNDVNERLRNGFNVVITGLTNAGKSSLINAIVQRNAVIVSDIEGTTRDAIDIALDIKGYPVIITDTAGIRETNNPIEKQGIDIAKDKIKNADIILKLYDATQEFEKEDYITEKEKVIYVANKIDKLSEEQKTLIQNKNHVAISAKYSIGINELIDKIITIIQNKFCSSSNNLITRIRYREALEDCCNNLDNFTLDKDLELASEDIRLASRAIGKITGYVEVEEILNNIFGSFCVGK